MKIARWGLGILLVMPLSGLAGQQQSSQQAPADPVAEAARRAREQKKDEGKTPHVWSNDDIPKTNGVSVVGETPAAGAGASAGDAANGANPAAAPAVAPNGDGAAAAPGQPAASEKTGAIAAELVTAKEQLKSLQTDLDIAQRKYGLDQQTYLSNPQHQDDVAGASQLRDEEDQIAAKQQEITDSQKKVDEIQARLTAAASAPTPPPPPRDDHS
jgi:hypothetical protein